MVDERRVRRKWAGGKAGEDGEEEVAGKRSKVSGRDVLGGTAGRQAASSTRC